MRRVGDSLLMHLRRARSEAILCAPFIKANTLSRVLDAVDEDVSVKVVTRWRAEEIAAGVSDLEVYDICAQRAHCSLALVDTLHAKIYLADGRPLVGSANLTASALGWCDPHNLELLTSCAPDDPGLAECLAQIALARPASQSERDELARKVATMERSVMPLAEDLEDGEAPDVWLPQMSAPARLWEAYDPGRRDRLQPQVLQAADADLAALQLPANLGEPEFIAEVGAALQDMPAFAKLLFKIEDDDLSDAEGAALIKEMTIGGSMSPELQWQVVREWLTVFLQDRLEIVPETFVTRRKPGVRRRGSS